jgi:TPR repeat protein
LYITNVKLIFLILLLFWPVQALADVAFNVLKKAAEQGDAEVQINLGNIYYTGAGMAEDNGDKDARYKLDTLC